ncbi:hypothetical protein [Agrococcus lahaulensis]|uniref:hypothetical protein n=1 Tax=Agrococcus lahaulensis TaxID=341722 RepID=UPI00047C2D12|nr:hypothetical protein [Agrococcus lahaulensis]
MSLELARRRAARDIATAALVAGLLAAVLTAIAAIGWLRDGLRYGCSPAATGGRVEWHCGDGLVLMEPGVAIVASGAIALLVAALVVLLAASDDQPRAHRPVVLALLACLPTIAVCLLLLSIASGHDAAEPVAPSRVALWLQHAMPALLATAAASLVAAVGVRLRAAGRRPTLARVLVLCALCLLLGAVALSMLGTLSTAVVAASIIAAGWWTAGAGLPAEGEAAPADRPAVGAEH